MRVFKDINCLYHNSNNIIDFKKILKDNGIYITNKIIYKLTSKQIKVYSKEIYLNLKKSNVKILTINSVSYPKQLFNIKNPPYTILLKGNARLLNKTKIYVYYNDYFDDYGKSLYNNLNKYLIKNKDIVLIKNINVNFDTKIINKSILFIKNITLEDLLNLDVKDNLVIYSNSDFSYYNILPAISNYFLIPQAKYEKCIVQLVDSFLNYGKDIYVVPGNIYNKNSYFSNHLIKEGAFVITLIK